ncbi:MAG TPA: TonB-dependent receptor [Burkholderiaceae bacterium]
MTFKRNAISMAALLSMGAATSLPVLAQDTQSLERVEITGTRLRTVGETSTAPVSTVSKEDIAISQPVAVEELVRGLPSSYPAIGPGINNGSNGTASIDLRGMGSNRTLVLMNGKRIVPATLGGVVDTNDIPVSLLERVDLLTGGASVTYGADAVAGVVNFVTKRNFSGIEASTSYSDSAKGDAKRYKNDLTMGVNLPDGRGNAVLHVGNTRTDPLHVGDRDYASTVISSTTGNPGGFSGTSVPAIWSGMAKSPALDLTGSKVIDSTTGLFRLANAGGPPDGYNTNPPNYFETPLKRTEVTAMGYYKINDYAEAYAEMFNVKSNVTLNLAPSGTFGVALNIPIGNPFISDPIRQQLCLAYGISTANCVAGNATEFKANIARRFVEAGPRVYNYDNATTQYTAGLRGDIPVLNGWSYDAYFQSGRSDQISTTANGFSFTKLQQAVRATNSTTCTVNTGGCVPVNLFGAAGTITPAMLAFMSIPTFQTTTVTQKVESLSATGEVPLAKSPWAKSALSLSLGAEHREVFGGNKSDNVIQTSGELLGSGAPTPDRNGTLKFNEYSTEFSMPLVERKPFVYSLNLDGGYRETEFKTSAGASQNYGSWKAGSDWSPMKGLRFRGEKQHATRAPNVNELYAPVTTGLSTLQVDPCQGANIVATDAGKAGSLTNLCQLTGVPTSQIGGVAAPSSNQVNNTSGGNPNLGPERADTVTLGLVYVPDFVDNLSLNIDYWKIKINGAVSSASAKQVVDGCFDATLNPGYTYNVFCQSIQRDSGNGGLNGVGSKGVITQSSNLGAYNYSGVDVGVNYTLPMKKLNMPSLGRLDFRLDATFSQRADIKALPSVATTEQAGHYGITVGTPYAKVRFNQRTTWSMGDWAVGYNWRFIGGTTVEADQTTGNGAVQPQFGKIKSINYFDLNVAYQVLKNVKLSATINNAFNQQPPFVGTGIGPGASNYGNTFPSFYDVIGRRYTMTATATF